MLLTHSSHHTTVWRPPIRAERDLARAHHDLFNGDRDGVLRALRAHAYLRLAEGVWALR